MQSKQTETKNLWFSELNITVLIILHSYIIIFVEYLAIIISFN